MLLPIDIPPAISTTGLAYRPEHPDRCYLYDPLTQAYHTYTYDGVLRGWLPPEPTPKVAEAFWFWRPWSPSPKLWTDDFYIRP
jgi:hypothetical protein